MAGGEAGVVGGGGVVDAGERMEGRKEVRKEGRKRRRKKEGGEGLANIWVRGVGVWIEKRKKEAY